MAQISIHAPRVGGDQRGVPGVPDVGQISIHAPRVGGDVPLRALFHPQSDFNPRPPCGGRRVTTGHGASHRDISIHAPRVGGDPSLKTVSQLSSSFQSTPPVWGATSGSNLHIST